MNLKDMYRTAAKPDRQCIGATLVMRFESPDGQSEETVNYSPLFDLKYGTNPNQPAQILVPSVYGFRVRELRSADRPAKGGPSLTNVEDTYWAAQTLKYFDEPAAAVMKHENASGIAVGADLRSAFLRAFYGDWIAAYGGSVCFNRQLDRETAELIAEQVERNDKKEFKRFIDIVAAPDFDEGVMPVLEKRRDVRIFKYEGVDRLPRFDGDEYSPCIKTIGGTNDMLAIEKPWLTVYRKPKHLLEGHPRHSGTGVVTKRQPTDNELLDMYFGMLVAANLRSNGVALVKDQYSLSPGTGQQDRERALGQAMGRVSDLFSERFQQLNRDGLQDIFAAHEYGFEGSVLASDGFLPFKDSVDLCAKKGIRAIVQHGGSVRDAEVITAADEHDIAMIFTGERSFSHH